MEEENLYDKIREIFGDQPGALSILEEKVDINLQVEYFEFSKNMKKDLDEQAVLKEMHALMDAGLSDREKKQLLVRMASIENVEAYRLIERFIRDGNEGIRDWAVLALQESRMLLESRLLDENQVFISTGLGGKRSGLRYFVVLIKKQDGEYTDLQRKIIRNEFEIGLGKHHAEIEKLEFHGVYATLMVIIPLMVPLKETFRDVIRECNQYGNFLKSNFIVTNVRELQMEEIEEFLRNQEQAKPENE
jgi:hypothetical protein